MGMDADGGEEEAYKLWEKKYVFVKKMVPGFVSEDFAKKVGRLLCIVKPCVDGKIDFLLIRFSLPVGL